MTGLLCAACAGAQTYDASSIDTSDCEIVSGQTEIEGTPQPFVGRACRQSNGVWVFVSEDDSRLAPDGGYSYYPSPWVWGSPVLFGPTVVFVDRFHHFHHFHGTGRTPSAGHSPGTHPWGAGHGRGWAGGVRRN